MALLGTTAILIVQALAAFAVIAYFHVGKHHPETANWFRTFLALLLGGIGMLYVIYLLGENASFAAGTAATDWVFTLIPYVVGVVGIGGILLAVFLKYKAPERYSSWAARCWRKRTNADGSGAMGFSNIMDSNSYSPTSRWIPRPSR